MRYMSVKGVGAWVHAMGIEPTLAPNQLIGEHDEPHASGNEPVNERQKWMLAQIDKCVELNLKNAWAHFQVGSLNHKP